MVRQGAKLGGEHAFQDKTPSLFCTLLLGFFAISTAVGTVIFSKLLFQFIISPSVPPSSEGSGEWEQLEWGLIFQMGFKTLQTT